MHKETVTVIFTTTPDKGDVLESGHSNQQYEMEEQYRSEMHMELKRDTSAYPKMTNGSNLDAHLPLFETYQFFNSGMSNLLDSASEIHC